MMWRTVVACLAALVAIGTSLGAFAFVLASPLVGRAYDLAPGLQTCIVVFEGLALALVSAYAIVGLLLVRQPGAGRVGLVAVLGLALVPVSVGIAVTRYRLYEIDRLISRGLSWALLSGLLVAVYAGSVLLLQGLLAGMTQGQTLAVAASTLLAAALFQPLRVRLQRAMDRRFDRSRFDGERVGAAFAERLRGQVDLVGLELDVAGTVDAALRPSALALWVRDAGHRSEAQ